MQTEKIRRGLVAMAGIGLAVALVGCAAPAEPAPEPQPEPEPVATVEEIPEAITATPETCLDAWLEENQAYEAGVFDDATLRATASACPSLDVWQSIREQIEYGDESPNLLRALCTFESDSPVCVDAKEQGALAG